jgi:hypothetical protein
VKVVRCVHSRPASAVGSVLRSVAEQNRLRWLACFVHNRSPSPKFQILPSQLRLTADRAAGLSIKGLCTRLTHSSEHLHSPPPPHSTVLWPAVPVHCLASSMILRHPNTHCNEDIIFAIYVCDKANINNDVSLSRKKVTLAVNNILFRDIPCRRCLLRRHVKQTIIQSPKNTKCRRCGPHLNPSKKLMFQDTTK